MMMMTSTTNWSNSSGFYKPYDESDTARQRIQRQLPAYFVAGAEKVREVELLVAAAAVAVAVVAAVAAGSNHRCY